ncbi:MAG: FkbM family methyltransferase [Lachnospiraceae bacterium]|nr:FkbM family methyltransferase [Lachnospiraceae bacterium]
MDLIEKIYDKNQYFGNDLITKAKGSIVDCGAYTGDTLKRFLDQKEDDFHYQYYAFEAEKENYDILLNYSRDLSNVQVFNIAVWDKQEKLSFEADRIGKVGGKAIKGSYNTTDISANALDNVIGDNRVDLITMDIEGAEIRALNGAKKIINKWKPCLAVSAYHAVEHLWEIPFLIKEMNNDYQIYFRHHNWNIDDTVCYGILKQENCK